MSIRGLEEVKRAMKAAPMQIQRKVLTAAVRGGAAEYLKIAERNLHPSHNTLRRSLKIRNRRPRRPYELRFTVHPERGRKARFDGWYAHIVEYGAKTHEITPSTKESLSIKGPSVFGNIDAAFAEVQHPGVTATYFMTRAFRQRARINKAIVKAGRRSFKRLKLKHGF